VLAWPGRSAREKNPYTWLLYSHLDALGVETRDFTPLRALRGGYDVLHVHWPEKAITAQGLLGRMAGAAVAIALLEAAHLHGAKIVWTAHNARPHESRDPRFERWFWSRVLHRVDAVIHPSLAGQAAIEARDPALAGRPRAVVRMGHYRGVYPDHLSRAEARAGFGIPSDARVLTFLGLVRPYKNVPHLIRTVRSLPPEAGVVLLVAGEPLTPQLDTEIREAAGEDPRVRLSLQHVPEADVQRYLLAADLVVLPFTDITNSGSALLALSFERPVLLPGIGAMGELQSLAGPEWVRTYDGELTGTTLCQAIAWAVQRPERPLNLQPLDWDVIARETRALYEAALAVRSGRR